MSTPDRPRRRGLRWMRRLGIAVLAFAAGMGVARWTEGTAPRLAPGPIDVGFAQSMSVHHDQAVAMAQLVRGRASPPIAQLAASIASTQTQEIGQMKGWLALWDRPLLPTDRTMAWMVPKPQSSSYDPAYVAECRAAVGGMPGLATLDELDALRTTTGPALDRLFLTLMLRHHAGGGPMLRYAAEHAETEVVRQAAGRMAYEQGREAGQLGSLLRKLSPP